jgi:hypothetical protein
MSTLAFNVVVHNKFVHIQPIREIFMKTLRFFKRESTYSVKCDLIESVYPAEEVMPL